MSSTMAAKNRVIVSRSFRMPAREVVRSRANPAYKRLLARKHRARADGLVLIEGEKLLVEALAAGLAVAEAALSESYARSGARLERELRARRIAVRVLSDALLDSLAEVETTQGVVALAEPPGIDAARLLDGVPLLVVACGIQNPGNLGGLLRTAEAAGATGAILTEGCADPFSWKSLRGSMGSAFRLPLQRHAPAAALPEALRARRIKSVASDAGAEAAYDAIDLTGPLAIWIGNEGVGVPAELLAAADVRARIPLRAPVESLNAGVAAGVLLFEAARQRGQRGA
jgi:TrmH family RNA methyltransferase